MTNNLLPFKNISHEIQLTIKRAIIALIFIGALATLLIVRLAYLQIYKQQLYQTLSINNFLDVIPITPTRGLIYDRNGNVLADNTPIFSLAVSIDTSYYRQQANKAALPAMLAKLQTVIPLSATELNNFYKQLSANHTSRDIPVKLRLSDAEMAHFSERQYLFPHVHVKSQLIRHYHFGASLSHVLGYVGQINASELQKLDSTAYNSNSYVGKVGIEKYFEEELHGKIGYQEVEVNASGQPLRILKQVNPQSGQNLFLTIDLELQLVAEQALGEHRGAIVALQPQTGQVLAMVSKPSYDPNILLNGMNIGNFAQLQHRDDHPLYNRAISGLYPLASTIKPYLALAGLENHTITANTTIVDPGWFKLPHSKHIFHDMRAHGLVNLTTAIATSCDVYFYNLAYNLGIDKMSKMLKSFGFGAPTGIEMDEEIAGVVATPEWKLHNKNLPWYPGDTIISAIGQGYMQATALQLAVAVATIANQGQRLAPTLVLGQENSNKQLELQHPVIIDTVKLADPNYWTTIINSMQQVIDSPQGTAHRFGPHPNYTVAAKTGTAQIVHTKRSGNNVTTAQELIAENLRDHGLIIAFAPTSEPQIALAIIVENARLAAVPIAKKILSYYFTKHHGN